MDGFTYQNIFDTKGIEYIIVIAFLLLLVPFWMVLNGQIRTRKKVVQGGRAIAARKMIFPQGLFYSPNHLWSFLEQSGEVKIGADHLLSQIAGDLEFTDYKRKGDRIQRGELLAGIHQDGKSLKIFSPVSGEITEVNSLLRTSPELIGNDPYSKGWFYKVKPVKWKEEISSLYLAEEALRWSETELDRFRNFLTNSITKYQPDLNHYILQDGGELVNRPLSELPGKIWEDFQENFLNVGTKKE